MALLSPNQRLFSFDSPLGPDLLMNAFKGTEQISALFEFDLELVSENPSLDWDQIVDKNVTVGLRQHDGTTFRYFNGYINHFEPLKSDGRLNYYQAKMVPWLWYLTQTSDNLIYQEKTIVQVIEATFQKYGFRDYDVKSLGDRHARWINCCQYGETAFSFVSRLMEAEGVYYYFKQENGKHTMMLVDHLSSHLPQPFQPMVRYEHQEGAGLFRTEDTIFESTMKKVIRPNKYAHKDFNFLIPSHELYYEAPTPNFMGSQRTLEVYDYPGDFEWQADAPDWGKLRQEELESDRVRCAGQGNCRSLAPGYKFDLTHHPRPEQNINYLVIKVIHEAHEGSWIAGSDAEEGKYWNHFESMPSSVQFRVGRKTEIPNIGSIQTARVVGPQGEEIYTDEYGRVKVHMHWDRTHPNEDSSCWIRVMQPIAGHGFGHIWIPRVGQEVIVQFVEGDPDRPVITGCLYNHENHPPYKLPDNKNWSGVMTRSTKKAQPSEFNELRFVDTRGDELYVMHAQKDMQISVENDTVEVVTRDRTLKTGRDQVETVGRDKHSSVSGSFSEEIQGQVSITAHKDLHQKVSGSVLLEAGGDIHLKAGGRIVLEAAKGITFLGFSGNSFIDVTNAGVAIQGNMVQINCGLGIPLGALSANPLAPLLPSLPGLGGDLSSLAGMSTIANLATGMTGALSGALGGALGTVSGALESAVSGVTGAATGALAGVTGALAGTVGQVTGEVTNALGQVTGELTGALGGVTGIAGNALEQLSSEASGALGSVTGPLSGAMGQINAELGNALNQVTDPASGILSGAAAMPGDVMGQIGGGISGVAGGIAGPADAAPAASIAGSMSNIAEFADMLEGQGGQPAAGADLGTSVGQAAGGAAPGGPNQAPADVPKRDLSSNPWVVPDDPGGSGNPGGQNQGGE